MRDNFNMLPIVQDNMNYIPTNLSSNGYYGYQPPLLDKQKGENCFMEVQQHLDNPPSRNRKRAWDFGTTTDLLEFKKRRQNDCSPFVYQQQSTNRTDANLRKPTHNIPDMPRCIMEKIIAGKKSDSEDLFEELLRETHGSNLYNYWKSDDL